MCKLRRVCAKIFDGDELSGYKIYSGGALCEILSE